MTNIQSQYAAIKAEQDELTQKIDAILADRVNRPGQEWEDWEQIRTYGDRLSELATQTKALNAQAMGDA